jgi:hypothetical protein
VAEERIDVVVTDGVDSSVEKKILGIAQAAEKGETYLNRLKAALASVNSTAVDRLAAAMAKADNAQAALINAQARLTNAQNAGSVAAEKVALAQQKIATEAARTEAAQQRAAAASSAAALAAQRLQAAAGAVTGASAGAANSQQQLASATAASGSAAGGAGNQWRAYINTMTQANNQAQTLAGGTTRVVGGLNQTTGAHQNYQRAARQTTAVNANIIAQIQDIGVSLAGGQNPLLVAIQQGSQLSYIASTMNGGMKALILTIGKMALAWAPVIVAVGAAYLAFRSFTNALNDTAANDKFVKSLGLTHKEIKKLGDTSITMGDTIKATFQVLGENILASLGLNMKEVGTIWQNVTTTVLKYAVAAFLGIGAAAVTLVKWIAVTGSNIGKIFYNAGIAAANLFLMGIQLLVNGTAKAMNAIGGFINNLSNKAGLGDVVGKFDEINLGVKGVTDGMLKLDSIDLGGEFKQGLENGLNTLKRIRAQAQVNHDERLRQKAKEIIADRPEKKPKKPKVDHTAENRAHAIDQVNLKLDDELSRMKMLKDAREIQQRMDQIEESLAQKKIHLTDKEREAILAKVTAIEKFKYVQAEMDRIYEAAIEPQRTYAASIEAINILLEKHAIDAQRASQEQVLASRKLAEAVNPFFQLEEGMTVATKAAGLYGIEVERNTYYESLRQAALAKGIVLGVNSTAAVDAQTAALMKQNDALLQQQYIQSQVSTIVNPLLDEQRLLDNKANFYAEIERLRQTDVLSEEQAQRAKYALDAKFSEMRLQGASQFFGTLAQLSSSGNKKLAMIGKAAAIAQTTIDGIVAVQKALASGPPPWNMINAAAIAAMTGANVARIISTPAGNFATGGQFMVEGRSGVDANNINMNVTRGERVTVETPAQQRANDSPSGNGAPAPVNVKSITLFDPRHMLDAMNTSEGEQVFISVIERRASEISRILG